jgi:signal peptidase II
MERILSILNRHLGLRTKIIIIITAVVALTGADLCVKQIVKQNLGTEKVITVVPGFWYFTCAKNDDIGFSILRSVTSGLGKTAKWALILCLQGICAVIAMIFYMYCKKMKYIIPLALIISGALGNWIDRLTRGYVLDYVEWHFRFIPMHLFNPWPIFNLADVYMSCGAGGLLIIMFFFDATPKQAPGKEW